jgi:MFS family permease
LVADLSEEDSQIATIITTLSYFVMTVLSLFVIERVGRKTLMLVGYAGMLCATIGLLTCLKLSEEENRDVNYPYLPFVTVALLVLFVCAYAIGPGLVPWVMCNELFSQKARPAAIAISNGKFIQALHNDRRHAVPYIMDTFILQWQNVYSRCQLDV